MVSAPLGSSMSFARVDYYRCDACNLVWTTEKGSTVVLARVTEPIKATLPQPSDNSGRKAS
jgi:hypothetical protein